MVDSLNRDIPVTQPFYPTILDSTGTVIDTLTDKAVYNWQSIRARGPNILNDTSLTGDTTLNGYNNSNDKEGTQPSGYSPNNPQPPPPFGTGAPWEVAPQTSKRLIWDYSPRIVSIRGEQSPFTGSNFQASWQVLNINVQSTPEPINLPIEGSQEKAFGTTQLECHMVFQGYLTLVESGDTGSGSAFAQAVDGLTLGEIYYIDTGDIVLQPNFNKWAQGNTYSVVTSCTANILAGTGAVTAGTYMPGTLNAYKLSYVGGNSPSLPTPYVPNSELDGTITIAAQFKSDKSDANAPIMAPGNQYFMSLVFDFVIVWNDALETNTPPPS